MRMCRFAGSRPDRLARRSRNIVSPAFAQTAAPGEGDDNLPRIDASSPTSSQKSGRRYRHHRLAHRAAVRHFERAQSDQSRSIPRLSQASGKTNLTDFLSRLPGADRLARPPPTTSGTRRRSSAIPASTCSTCATSASSAPWSWSTAAATSPAFPAIAAVDVNTIPTDLIERVDVLTGGASAIYGADGVSGVVNFILKKNFEGIAVRGQAGILRHGDAANCFGSAHRRPQFRGRPRQHRRRLSNITMTDRLTTRDRADLRGANYWTAAAVNHRRSREPVRLHQVGADNGIPDVSRSPTFAISTPARRRRHRP